MILRPYLDLFKTPGVAGFALAGLLARMPLSMTGIGLITMLSQLRGAYTLAGAVAATFALCMALLAPQVSRLVDRHGQSRVLPLATGVSVLALAALLACTRLGAPDWTLFLFAALAGCMPSMPAMVRARWTLLYRGRPQLQTAFALEAILDDVAFIAGPPISVGLSVAAFPEAGPLAALLLLALGVAVFVSQRATEPPVNADAHRHAGGSVMRLPGLRALVLVMLGMGVIVGTVDVGSVAFATRQGNPADASIVLSVYAAGSFIAGLVFGALRLSAPLHCMLMLAGAATALTTLPLLLAASVLTLAMAVFVAGMSFAPTITVAMGLVEHLVPPARLTEGMTWLLTGLGVGVALGAALAGWAVDGWGVRAGFVVSTAAAALVFASAALASRLLQPQSAFTQSA